MGAKGSWYEAPRVLHREKPDPELLRALVFSLAGHLLLIGVAVVFGSGHSRPVSIPAYRVGLTSAPAGSKILSVGPLARKPSTKPKPAPKAEAKPKAAPKPAPKAETKPKTAPKPAPEPKAKVEAKPKPAPKAEAKPKSAPKPAPEPKAKVEAKPKPAPKAEAKPKAAPKPASKTEAKPKTAPKPVPEPKAKVEAKPKATPETEAKAAPTGSVGTSAGRASSSPSAGGGSSSTGATVVRDAAFVRYYNLMIDSIRQHWVWVGSERDNLSVTVRFGIGPDGTIRGVKRTSSSGNPHFDQSVENAVRSVGRLEPPPVKFRRDFADVELVFRASDLVRR